MQLSRTQIAASILKCALVVRAFCLCAPISGLLIIEPCFSQTTRLPPVSDDTSRPPGSIEERLQQLETANARATERFDALVQENQRLTRLLSGADELRPPFQFQPIAPLTLPPPPMADEEPLSS